MIEFAPTPREGEAVLRLPSGGWRWTCDCGFDAYLLEDVGGHRQWHREQTAKLLNTSCNTRPGR